jgi:hypothetical protein
MKPAILLVLLVGCAASGSPDDGEAEAAVPTAPGKADGASFTGVYASHLTHHYSGDVPDLELRADGVFVRQRCYHASCAIEVPETDHYDVYTTSSGKTYVRFHGQDIANAQEIVADVYEIRAFSKGIQLRRAYSTRWQALYLSSPGLACAATGGTYTTDCACPQPYPAQSFVPGAGGCIPTPAASETNCDDSHGMWTDDDATPIESFCICAVGQYLGSTGSCADL